MKKLKNTDLLYVIVLSSVFILHVFFVFIVPFSQDEGFYVSIPFRLVNGDSLIQHEWHLTQFSSLFSYLPVYLWTIIKGSTEYMFVFLRCIYLLIHTTIAVVIYRFFRKYGKWAIMASLMFYIQSPYRILSISYQSMFVVFLLLLSLSLISIYEKKSVCYYVFAGISFGCCCVNNPFFCLIYAVYLLACLLWTKRKVLASKIIEIKTRSSDKKGKKLTKKQKREQKQQLLDSFPDMESYCCFFTGKAILWITCGIIMVAVIALVFFFATGGTIDSIFDNIEYLLGSSEYDIASQSVFEKFIITGKYFSMANFGMPWILLLVFVVLFFDNKRKYNTHRFSYIFVIMLWAIMFMCAVLLSGEIYLCAISLPFYIISIVCYLLTEKKNKPLFYCMFLPCSIATFVQYLAADTHWAAIGIVLVACNVAGVFFAMDLWKEMRSASGNDAETTPDKNKSGLYCSVIIAAFCLQIAFYGIFYQYRQLPGKDAVKATTGPYSGLYMTEEQYDSYNKSISDLDVIKTRSKKDTPVLISSYDNWMYIYLERPFATYTTWYRGSLDMVQLKAYYRENPEKIPKYIYFESSDPQNTNVKIASELFEFSRENLSNGVLLTVEKRKF